MGGFFFALIANVFNFASQFESVSLRPVKCSATCMRARAIARTDIF